VKVHCDEDLASHIGSRVMRAVPSAERKVRGEALTAVHAGLVMNRERILIQDADAVPLGGRQHTRVRDASVRVVLRGL
jgi:hypothetical protein